MRNKVLGIMLAFGLIVGMSASMTAFTAVDSSVIIPNNVVGSIIIHIS